MSDPDAVPGPGAATGVDGPLAELARAHGVATRYRDAGERTVEVSREVVVEVLAALDVDASDERAVAAARAALADAAPPPTVVLVPGATRDLGPGVLVGEDGSRREVAGALPADLPVGYHVFETGTGRHTVLVPPAALPPPPRTWGWSVQLYAVTSAGSWGCGDLGDLGTVLGRTHREQGAGAVLCNPLHALRLDDTVEPSPYSPSSRRFVHPLYLRVPDTAAYAAAPPAVRDEVDALGAGLAPGPGELIDYDAVWAAKRGALELLRPYAPDDVPAAAVESLDPEHRDVATWYALAERHGPRWRRWPAGLRSPAGADVAAARRELADRVGFHAWCQRLADEQLARAHAAAGGMAVGLVADLAVGCAPDGADAWALQDALAADVHVGAPPDDFNPHGQDWSLPPWRPDALARAGYAPLRSMLRAVLRHADGIRVDHVAGLWRLWWIPPGRPATEGTYVSYDAEAMLAVLAIEAQRAGAVVVGEDLGTVEPEVTEGLAQRGMLGCAVLWFQRDDAGALLAPPRWAADTLASISTHDLPTAVGFLRDEHVRARHAAGLLDDDEAGHARDQAARDRTELAELLVAEGVVDPGAGGPGAALDPADEAGTVLALHRLLARAGSRIVLAAFTDVVDEPRQPNLPGTTDAYPNWRLPLPLDLDELLVDPRVRRVAEVLAARPGPARGDDPSR